MNFKELLAALAQAKSKQAVLSVLAGYFSSHLVVMAPFVLGIIFLMFLDLYSGVRAAKKRNEVIRSKGLWKTTIKIKEALLVMLGAYVAQLVWFPSIPLVYLVSSYIAITEIKSNMENFGEILGIDVWNVIQDKLPAIKKTKGK